MSKVLKEEPSHDRVDAALFDIDKNPTRKRKSESMLILQVHFASFQDLQKMQIKKRGQTPKNSQHRQSQPYRCDLLQLPGKRALYRNKCPTLEQKKKA